MRYCAASSVSFSVENIRHLNHLKYFSTFSRYHTSAYSRGIGTIGRDLSVQDVTKIYQILRFINSQRFLYQVLRTLNSVGTKLRPPNTNDYLCGTHMQKLKHKFEENICK